MRKLMWIPVAFCALSAASVAGEGKIIVRKAIYGVPGDATQSRDVTAEVQALAAGETLSLPVWEMAKGGDPAPQVEKTLRVEYSVDGMMLVAEAKDGQSVYLGKPKVLVKKAVYGVLDDAARTRDVTAEVRALAVGEALSLPVWEMAKGGDPAPQVEKTLRVEYSVDGMMLVAEAIDGQSVYLGKPKVLIQKAVYGVLDDATRTRDVTAEVQALMAGETLSLPVSDMARGGDPAPQVIKTLRVEYIVDGKPFTASGKDLETIHIGAAVAK